MMEFEQVNWENLQKQFAKKLWKRKETQRLLLQAGIGLAGTSLAICYQIRRRRFHRLCLEMAKLDHDIAVYVIHNSDTAEPLNCSLRSLKKDLRYRYKLYLKLNKDKSAKQIKAEIEDLKNRRLKSAHQFDYDLRKLQKTTH